MFLFPLFEEFIDFIFKFSTQGTHLHFLLLHQFGFKSEDLLVTILHVCLLLLSFKDIAFLLDLVSLLIVLLLSQVGLDLSFIQESGRELESQGQAFL